VKKLAAAGALACTLTAVVAGAAAGAHSTAAGAAAVAPPLVWGVADDTGKYADDGGAWFDAKLQGANLGEERWTLSFSPDRPTSIDELSFLQRAAPQAQRDGIKVVLALYSRPGSAHDPDTFCAWAALVASTVSAWGIHDFIVWNEPNTQLYWSPQNKGAPASYEALLAACYDSIHAADPDANVIGFGLSPRSSGPTQTAPIPFIEGVGAAYRASGRTAPLMDEMSVHPYPNPNHPIDAPDVGYANPDFYGIPNLDRVKQALYDAFDGTGQPTTVDGLMLVIDEVGWQTTTTQYPQYVNRENVSTIDEATQTRFLEEAAETYFACDPSVAAVNLFLLVDETSRNGRDATGKAVGGGWQSGLLTAGGRGVSTAKQAYRALAPVFAAGRAACEGKLVSWQPSTASSATGSAGGETGKRQTAKPHGKQPADPPGTARIRVEPWSSRHSPTRTYLVEPDGFPRSAWTRSAPPT
jgi:hypothetical protein